MYDLSRYNIMFIDRLEVQNNTVVKHITYLAHAHCILVTKLYIIGFGILITY